MGVSSTFGGVEEAMAFTDSSIYNGDFSGSATLIAGRSGGRMGGRSSMRSMPRRSAPSSSYQRRTVVQPGGVMVAPPPVVISPFGYSPFGFGYGFGALNAVGNEIRDFRQEGEIQG